MAIKIALAGNPNCGKTTLFNALTGSNQYVGNWPGVTVEKKDGKLKGAKDAVIQDLPGIYSLSPYSLEEVVARNYLVYDKPDAILNIVDGSNLERNLYLTTQLVELGIPMVVAVNMMDVVRKRGDKIDIAALSKKLGCKVVEISALTGEGVREAAAEAVAAAESCAAGEAPHVFTGSVEHAIAHIEESLQGKVAQRSIRWSAIKVFERDRKAIETMKLDPEIVSHVEGHIKDCEKELDDDAESIITTQRYNFIKSITGAVLVKAERSDKLTLSDKIDRVVTNRWLALPIFAAVIWFMYYVSVTTVGGWLTDWANDGVFGDGWHLAYTTNARWCSSDEVNKRNDEIDAANEKNAAAIEAWTGATEADENYQKLSGERTDALDKNIEVLAKAFEDGKSLPEALQLLQAVPSLPETLTIDGKEIAAVEEEEGAWEQDSGAFEEADKRISAWESAYEAAFKAKNGDDAELPKDEEGNLVIDTALAARVWAPVVFDDEESGEVDHYEIVTYDTENEEASITSWKAAKEVAEPDPSDYGVWIPGIPALFEKLFAAIGVGEDSFAHSLVFDGIIAGVGTVLGFVPQIIIIFLFLAFLEGCGYMARIAFIMDRIFRRFGLSGKSFIPMIVGMGCGVPAVMATRTIESRRDRRMTIMLGTYIPCGAKYAIIAMFTTAFFGGSAWVATSMYFLGVAVIVLGGIALKKTKPFYGDPAPFVMELPAYHMPTCGNVLRQTWERTRAYMIKAGTIIFAACVVLWVLMSFDWGFNAVELEESMLHDIGDWIKWIFAPLGFGHWQGAVASVTSEIAKEEAVATLAQLSPEQASGAAKGIFQLFAGFNGKELAALTGLSFMIMNLFDPPCLVAIAVTYREMASKAWGTFAVLFQFAVGYSLALVTYQLGAWLVYGQAFGAGTAVALALVAAIAYMVFRPAPQK